MPLPENWKGRFYDAASGGDMLFDLEPEVFAKAAGNIGENVPFLIAGAYIDLTLNGHADRAGEFLEIGRRTWGDKYDWELLTTMVAEWQAGIEDGHYLYNAIAEMFDDVPTTSIV